MSLSILDLIGTAEMADNGFYHDFAAANIIVGLLGLLANSILIHALRKCNKLTSNSFKFILILSASDLISSIIIVIGEPAAAIIHHQVTHDLILQLSTVGRYLCGEFSTIITLVIAVDRYLHLKYSSRYHFIMTSGRAKTCVAVAALTAIIIVALLGLSYQLNWYTEMLATISVATFLLLLAICIVYYRALKSVAIQVKGTESENVRISKGYNKGFSKAVLFILVSLLVLVTPFIIFRPISWHYQKTLRWTLIVNYTAQILIALNGTVNAALFLAFNRDLKRFVQNIFPACKRNRSNRENGDNSIQIVVRSSVVTS